LYLSDIKRSVEILRIKAKDMRDYPEFHQALLAKEGEMEAFGQNLLEKVGVLRMSTLVRLRSASGQLFLRGYSTLKTTGLFR
jgi:hypothetical protein